MRFIIVLLILTNMAVWCLWLDWNVAGAQPPSIVSPPNTISLTLVLKPGGMVRCAIVPPAGKTRGYVSGWWVVRASGQTIRCQISGADDAIARTYDHAPSGSFTLRFPGDGGYRFSFADADHKLRGACQVDVFAVFSPQ